MSEYPYYPLQILIDGKDIAPPEAVVMKIMATNADGSTTVLFDRSEFEPEGPKVPVMDILNKIVRDKIPKLMREQGLEVNMVQLTDPQDIERELLNKLAEEMEEFRNAPEDKKIEELADIAEVVSALSDLRGGYAPLIKAKIAKGEEKGKFQKLYFVNYTVKPE
jgi:predicted house-cleaning noncanonical NTP pyrophosphatase (MazG superfamily)